MDIRDRILDAAKRSSRSRGPDASWCSTRESPAASLRIRISTRSPIGWPVSVRNNRRSDPFLSMAWHSPAAWEFVRQSKEKRSKGREDCCASFVSAFEDQETASISERAVYTRVWIEWKGSATAARGKFRRTMATKIVSGNFEFVRSAPSLFGGQMFLSAQISQGRFGRPRDEIALCDVGG